MPSLAHASLGTNLILFAASALIIGIAGTRLAGLADRLADRTGMGEAIMGGVFLGIGTSLPGVSASVTAAVEGFPALAISNAAGGIAAQTAFLAVADLFYRRANLEHAAASLANMLQGALLIILLSLAVMAIASPPWTIGHVHPGTLLIPCAYLLGWNLIYSSKSHPMWRPQRTAQTREDKPADGAKRLDLGRLWLEFVLMGFLVVLAGAMIAGSGGRIVTLTGLSETLMGGIFVAISTSLPELVTTIAAVRRGALTLAVGNIVGGNTFDVLFLCVADVAYAEGSLYHAGTRQELFMIALAILLNVILLLGLLQRQKHGFANIGFESFLIFTLYLAGVAVVAIGP